MKVAFLAVVFLHGLIHLLGFVKAFGIADVKALTLPISKPLGLAWLAATVLFLIYGILHYSNNKYAWLIGFVAVAVSQILIILFWKDAKFGTLANLLILLASVVAFGHYQFQKRIQLEVTELLGQVAAGDDRVLTEKDIEGLPESVQNWLQHSGAIGKPYIRVGKVWQQAEMKTEPGQKSWLPATAVQYTAVDEPAFIWSVDVNMNALLQLQGRDKLRSGQGEMLIKMHSLFNVVNETGEKLNEGTMQRYLGEMVWFPSLALSPHISWQAVNDTTAIATIEHKGTKASGTFFFNREGDFVRYVALRYLGNDQHAQRYEWVLDVHGYKTFEGIKVPSNMQATWKLDEGDWIWLKLEVLDLKFNDHVSQ